MKLCKGQTARITIDRMAYGGQGIGRIDGFVVFVPGAIPGDTITARIYKKKKDLNLQVIFSLYLIIITAFLYLYRKLIGIT